MYMALRPAVCLRLLTVEANMRRGEAWQPAHYPVTVQDTLCLLCCTLYSQLLLHTMQSASPTHFQVRRRTCLPAHGLHSISYARRLIWRTPACHPHILSYIVIVIEANRKLGEACTRASQLLHICLRIRTIYCYY